MLKNKNILISAICGALLMVTVITLLIINIVLSTKIISSPQGKIYSGEIAQADAKPGDLFFNTTNYSIYKKNDDGSWTVIGNLTDNKDSTVKSINKVSSAGDVDTYEMTFANGSKSSFQIYKNEQILPQIEILDGFWAIGGVKTNVSASGKGILKIEFKEAKENTDVYEITYTDNTTSLFEMPKAKNGETPRIGENGNWFIGDTDTGIKAGAGRGIKSINKKSTDGLVDTYEIVFDDDETFEFTVTNAVQEKDITIGENGNWFIGGVDTNVKATGNGIKEVSIDDEGLLVITFTDGSEGKYDVLPEYLKNEYEVRFHLKGHDDNEAVGDIVTTKVKGGMRVEKPEDPVKRGYKLDGWYDASDEKWAFSIYTVSFDLDLYAKFSKKEFTVTLDPNGGELSNTSFKVLFNDNFTLPTPSLTGYEFNGWYLGNELVEDGIYDFDSDINLVASFTEKETDTFKISNAFDFNKIYENLDKNFILQNDIDLENSTLKAFGDEEHPFTGTFDGQGYKISNFSIDSNNQNYNSLFIRNTGEIKNLKLENVVNENNALYASILCGINEGKINNVEILGDSRIESNAKYKAMLVAHNKSIELYKNINVEGIIEDFATKKEDFLIGGIICYSEEDLNIEDVTSNININVRLNVDKDSTSEYYNQATGIAGVISKVELDKNVDIKNVSFDGSINVTLSVYCDNLNLETNVGAILSEVGNLTASKIKSNGNILVKIDGMRDGLGELNLNKITHITNNLAALSSRVLNLNLDDAELKSVLSLQNNLKCAHKPNGENTSNIFLENNISAIGNKLSSFTGNHIYSNISVSNTASLDSNKLGDENLNEIILNNNIAGLVTTSPSVLVDGAIVDFHSFENSASFVNDTNYTKNDMLRYAFKDVDEQTTNITNGIYKINDNIIDNTVADKLINNNDYVNDATIFVALGFDNNIWKIEDNKLTLNF